MTEDPVLAGLRRMMARLDAMERHISELEDLIHRLFALERKRFNMPPAPEPPKPH